MTQKIFCKILNLSYQVCCFFCFFFSLLPVSNFWTFEIRMSNFRIFEHSKVQMSRKYSKIPKHFLKKLQKSQTLAASQQCFCLALRLVTLCCLELNLYSEFIRVDHDSTGYERQTDELCYGSFKFFTTFTMTDALVLFGLCQSSDRQRKF